MDRRPLHPGWSNYPESLTDLLRVIKAQEDSHAHRPAIANLTASVDDTLDWYHAQDPLNEMRYFSSLAIFDINGKINEKEYLAYLEEQARNAQHYENAAANLIARTMMPEYFETDVPPAQVFLEGIKKDYADDGQVFDDMELTSLDIIVHCIGYSTKKDYSDAELKVLIDAADMLSYAAGFSDELRDIVDEKITKGETLDTAELNRHQAEVPTERQKLLNQLTAPFLYLAIAYSGRNYQEAGRYESAENYLRAMMRTSKHAIGPTRNGRDVESQEHLFDGFRGLIDAAEYVFTGPDSLQTRFKNDPSVRGLLHEYMWYLDFSLLLWAEQVQDIHLVIANSSQDEPHINHPSKRRGVDFFSIVMGGPDGWTSHGVNLKSRPHPNNKQPYHPEIRELPEKNLMEMNPKAMGAKLALYKKLIEQAEKDGGFKQGIEPVRHKLLGTVIEEYEHILNTKNHDFTPGSAQHAVELAIAASAMMGLSQAVPLNREHRRALAKDRKRRGLK
jgi:hypothetical protein